MRESVIKKCPLETVLSLIGCKWKILIMRDLLEGTKRFGEIKKSTGCSQKVLTANLREMEEDELIIRKVYAQVPPKVEYSLTDIGLSMAPILDSMAGWGMDFKKYCELRKKKNLTKSNI